MLNQLEELVLDVLTEAKLTARLSARPRFAGVLGYICVRQTGAMPTGLEVEPK